MSALSLWMNGERVGAWSVTSGTHTMALRSRNPHYHIDKIQARHWLELSRRYGLQREGTFVEFVHGLPAAIDSVGDRLPPGFPDAVWSSVTRRLHQQADRFLRGLQADDHAP